LRGTLIYEGLILLFSKKLWTRFCGVRTYMLYTKSYQYSVTHDRIYTFSKRKQSEEKMSLHITIQ